MPLSFLDSHKTSRRVTRFLDDDETLFQEEWHDDHYKEMVLIQSIGNVGLDSSRPLLVMRLNDSDVPSILRRAAAHALGQYRCNEVRCSARS